MRLGKLPKPPTSPRLAIDQALLSLPFVAGTKQDITPGRGLKMRYAGEETVCEQSLFATWKAAYDNTQRKRQWFYNAAAEDGKKQTHLGTLNYLPVEIRDQIWLLVLESEYTYQWSIKSGRQIHREFDMKTYWEGDYCSSMAYWKNLLHTSNTIKRELKNLYFSIHSFHFTCAASLYRWVRSCTDADKATVRQINITPFACENLDHCGPGAWVQALKWLSPAAVWHYNEPSRAIITVDIVEPRERKSVKGLLDFVEVGSAVMPLPFCVSYRSV